MLLIRPYPKITDTLPNYLLRLTAENGYKNPMQLLRNERCLMTNSRLPSKKIFFGDFDLVRMAVLANLEVNQLYALQFKHTFSTRCLSFEQEFLTKTINLSTIRICPKCFQEQQSVPFINSLVARTYCTKHNCLLLANHPTTNRRLTWATHFFWRDTPKWISFVQASDVCMAERSINAQLESLQKKTLVINNQSLNLAEYCDLLEFFARFHQVAYCSSVSTKYDFESSRKYYAPAYWYISEWPLRYFELLAHFEYQPMSSSRLTGVRKSFRDLYDDLYSQANRNSVAYQLLKSGFEQYLQYHYSNGLLMSSLTTVSHEVKAESSFISKDQIAKTLNCCVSRVNLYIREGLLTASKTLVNGTDLFKRQDALELKEKLKQCLSLNQLSDYLSISHYHTRLLLQADIIQPLLSPSDSNRDWLIERSETDKLVRDLIAGASTHVEQFTHAIKRYTFSKVSFASLIKSMLSGDIEYSYKADRKQPHSLMQFFPSVDNSDEPHQLFVTPAEAVTLLSVNKNAIYDFIKFGYLKSEKISVKRTPRPVKMISTASIANFKSRYLLSNQLSLPKANYEKLSGPKIDGCCVNLFSKVQP